MVRKQDREEDKEHKYRRLVYDVISQSEVLLMVLDARFVEETINYPLIKMIQKKNKKIIFVLNKADLVSKDSLEAAQKSLEHTIFMSAKYHMGTNILRQKIMAVSQGKAVKVGVIGYPNTGKSSVINALAGRGKALTGLMPGVTKGIQWIKVSDKIYMLDTPGVIPISERGDMKHLIIASQDPHKAEHPEDAAEYLLENNKNKLEKWYGIKPTDADTGLELLEKITLKLNCKKKGNLPDLRRGAIMVLRNWQKGKQ